MKILIVDDDPVSRRILREIVATMPGHQVTEAPDGGVAWELLDHPSRYFDVVFLDVSMPQTNGLQLLKRIRDSQHLFSTRVVMCTATSDRATVSNAIQLGTRHFIVKPATAGLVQTKLRDIQAKIDAENMPRTKVSGVVTV
jgi:two-component system chemotaxis response regulator CheY